MALSLWASTNLRNRRPHLAAQGQESCLKGDRPKEYLVARLRDLEIAVCVPLGNRDFCYPVYMPGQQR